MKKLNFWYSPTRMFRFQTTLNVYESYLFTQIFYEYTRQFSANRILIDDEVKIKYCEDSMSRTKYLHTLGDLVESGWITIRSERGRNGGIYVKFTDKLFEEVRKKNWEGSWPVRK